MFFSGGIGSLGAAKEVYNEATSNDKVKLMFTDTLIEDNDLYRFLIESSGYFSGTPAETIDKLVKFANELTLVEEDMDKRKYELSELRNKSNKYIRDLVWLSDGRDVWDVFMERRFLGNSRIATCSHALKQDVSRKYIRENFDPTDTVLYLGIDWTEIHRTKAPIKNWAPYDVKFPLCENEKYNKIETVKFLDSINIEIPKLYEDGFTHNNCGGFCVRGGQGHFSTLLKTNRPLYLYHERREQEVADMLEREVTILRKQRNKQKYYYSLRELREDVDSKNNEVDMLDIGGCGCFVAE